VSKFSGNGRQPYEIELVEALEKLHTVRLSDKGVKEILGKMLREEGDEVLKNIEQPGVFGGAYTGFMNDGVSLLISEYMSWCLRFSPRFPTSGSPLRARPGGAEGLWPCLSLIGVAGCLGWISDCARIKELGGDAV